MGERYVRPPLLAKEPAAAWRALWCVRLLGLLGLALLLLAALLLFRELTGATAQDPGVGALVPARLFEPLSWPALR